MVYIVLYIRYIILIINVEQIEIVRYMQCYLLAFSLLKELDARTEFIFFCTFKKSIRFSSHSRQHYQFFSPPRLNKFCLFPILGYLQLFCHWRFGVFLPPPKVFHSFSFPLSVFNLIHFSPLPLPLWSPWVQPPPFQSTLSIDARLISQKCLFLAIGGRQVKRGWNYDSL